MVRNTSPEKKSLAPKFIITRKAKRLTVESSPFTEVSTVLVGKILIVLFPFRRIQLSKNLFSSLKAFNIVYLQTNSCFTSFGKTNNSSILNLNQLLRNWIQVESDTIQCPSYYRHGCDYAHGRDQSSEI